MTLLLHAAHPWSHLRPCYCMLHTAAVTSDPATARCTPLESPETLLLHAAQHGLFLLYNMHHHCICMRIQCSTVSRCGKRETAVLK